MAAKPSVVPTWATNTNYSTGEFAGTATKAAPSAGVRQDGHVPDTAPGAQHENYDRNLIGAWLDYLSDGDLEGPHQITSNTPAAVALFVIQEQTATEAFNARMPAAASVAAGLFEGGLEVYPGDVISPRGFRQCAQGPIALRDTEEYRYCDSTGTLTTKTRQVMIPLVGAYSHGGWVMTPPTGSQPHIWITPTAATTHHVVFEPKIVQGAIVTQVRAGVWQDTDHATDIKMEVYSIDFDKVVATGGADPTPLHSTATLLGSHQPAPDVDDGHILSVSGLTHTVGVNSLVIQITASGSGGADRLFWIELTYSDPGPRNC